jgi:hypothetical protein
MNIFIRYALFVVGIQSVGTYLIYNYGHTVFPSTFDPLQASLQFGCVAAQLAGILVLLTDRDVIDTVFYNDCNTETSSNCVGLKYKRNVSQKMTDFMGLKNTDQVSTADAYAAIRNYIKENDLQRGRYISLDSKLKQLLERDDMEGEIPNVLSFAQILRYAKPLLAY